MQSKDRNSDSMPEEQNPERKWAFSIRRNNRTFSPPTDVIELSDKIVVQVEIAGMNASNLDLTLMDRGLTISGTREHPQHSNPAYHQVEIGYGDFRIDVALPWAIERESVTASYEAGFLIVDLPRKQPRQIHVVNLDGGE